MAPLSALALWKRGFALSPNAFFAASRSASFAHHSSLVVVKGYDRRCTRLFAVTEDLENFKDSDPADEDEEGTKTKEMLSATLSTLERALVADPSELVEGVFAGEEDVTRKKVTGAIPELEYPQFLSAFTRLILQFLFPQLKSPEAVAAQSNAIPGAIKLIRKILDLGVFKKEQLDYASYPRHPEVRWTL